MGGDDGPIETYGGLAGLRRSAADQQGGAPLRRRLAARQRSPTETKSWLQFWWNRPRYTKGGIAWRQGWEVRLNQRQARRRFGIQVRHTGPARQFPLRQHPHHGRVIRAEGAFGKPQGQSGSTASLRQLLSKL